MKCVCHITALTENSSLIKKIVVPKNPEGAMAESKTVRVEISNNNGKSKATVTTTVNGVSATETFEGTEAEVKAKVDALK